MLTDKDAQGCSKKVVQIQDTFCVDFVCSPRVITDFPQVLWLPFTIQRHAWGLIKLAEGVNGLLLSLEKQKKMDGGKKNKVVNK